MGGYLGMMKVSELLCMPEECVYALVCHENKRFMVGYTTHLLSALSRMRHDLETPKYRVLKSDIENVVLEILETGIQNLHDKKVKTSYYVQKYIEEGYQQYIPSNSVKYEVHTDIFGIGGFTYFVVYLKDRRKNKVIVGLFRNADERDKFLTECYPGGKVSGIHYANNSYTINYMKKYGIMERV
jgi:hypothetical protein